MDTAHPPSRTHLFTVRVWREDLGEGQTEWRGAAGVSAGNAAKARRRRCARALEQEQGKSRINVSTQCPSGGDSGRVAAARGQHYYP